MLLKEDHIDEPLLEKKILELFEYRFFPELIASHAPEFNFAEEPFYQKLIELQKRIYYLDAHLEAHEYPDENTLKLLWAQIHEYLTEFGVEQSDWPHYTRHILRYQKHEMDLRLGKWPVRFNMSYFYYFKSCDVKLIRRLIYENYGVSKNFIAKDQWKYFDLITEVNDDIMDVWEDLDFVNGNSFLISLLLKGKAVTQSDFSQFIDEIEQIVALKYINTHPGKVFDKKVHDLTIRHCRETKSLLSLVMDQIEEGALQNAKIHNLISKHLPYEKSGHRFAEGGIG